MSEPFFGMKQLLLDMLDAKTTNVLGFDALKKIPNPFLGIQFRRISRQAFKTNAFGSPFCQKIFDGLTAVNGCSIPDHHDFAGDLAQEKLQEADHVWAFVGMVL